jgi:hypothetical protein
VALLVSMPPPRSLEPAITFIALMDLDGTTECCQLGIHWAEHRVIRREMCSDGSPTAIRSCDMQAERRELREV